MNASEFINLTKIPPGSRMKANPAQRAGFTFKTDGYCLALL